MLARTSAPDASASPDGGFDPRVNGFSFANYDNAPGVTNLTRAEMLRLFGRDVCEPASGDACELNPVARAWMENTNNRMDIGHCEGMAVLSELLQQNVLQASGIQSGARSAHELPFNAALQREIALWWATQFVTELTSEQCPTAAEMLRTLEQGATFGSTAASSLAVYLLDSGAKRGGHAVTPIGVERLPGDQADVLIYDGNFPDQTRRIHYSQVSTGAWTYRVSETVGMEHDYDGTDATNSVCLRPLRARLAQPARCYFCGNYQAPTTLTRPQDLMNLSAPGVLGDRPRVTSMSGAANLALRSGTGAMMATRRNRPLGIDPTNAHSEAEYVIPEGVGFEATIDGAGLSAMSLTDLRVFGQGYSVAVEGIHLDPREVDEVFVAPFGAGILYHTTRMESARVTVGVTLPGADWRFAVSTVGAASGQVIAAELDSARQVLIFYLLGSVAPMNTFDLEVNRTDDNGNTLTFRHAGALEPDGSTLNLHYGAWERNGQDMQLGVVPAGSAAEVMTTLSDQNTADGGVAPDA